MALSGDSMGDEIVAAIDAAIEATPHAGEAQTAALWRAIGGAIVAHIQANAEVTTFVSAADAGLQAYVVPPGAAVPTVPNAALVLPVPLAERGTVE